MRSVTKVILFLLVGQLVFAYSCKKSEEPGVPQVSVIADKSSASPGDVVNISINATADPSRNLKELLIQEITSGTSGAVKLVDSTFKKNNIGYTFAYTVPSNATGSKEIKVTATDDAGDQGTGSVTINITAATTLSSCDATSVGSYDNTSYGSFYSTSECKVYNVSGASANQSKVDFIYFYGSQNAATLAAPDDNEDFGNNSGQINSLGVQNWTSRNATRFKKTSFGTVDFDNATAASVQSAYTTAIATESFKANSLQNGDIVAFKTASGKYGLIKITNITSGGAGSATVTVKVQK